MPVTPDALDIVTLVEAREFLKPRAGDTGSDDEMQRFITRLTPAVETEVGPVVQRAEIAAIDGACGFCETSAPKWPMVSVTSGTYLSDGSAVVTSKMVSRKGLIVTTDGSPLPLRPWTMTYLAGRVANTAAVPGNIKGGALEMLKLAWATQRGQDAPAFLVSYRASAWFKSDQYALGFA